MTTLTRKSLELAIAGGTAVEADFADISVEEVLDVKASLPYQRRFVPQVATKVVDVAAKTADLIYNTQVVDRMGDLVIANPADAKKMGDGEGWITSYFVAAGAPYLHMHNPEWVVGRVETIQIRRIDSPPPTTEGKVWALTGRTRFFDHEILPYSEIAWLLTVEGINGSSVGFLPRKVIRIEDDKERGKLGLGRWGMLVVSSELLEVSKAPLPANQLSTGTEGGKGAEERSVLSALDRFVEQGKLGKALRDDFVRDRPVGPTDYAERTAARVASFFDFAVRLGMEPKVECVDGTCTMSAKAAQSGYVEIAAGTALPKDFGSFTVGSAGACCSTCDDHEAKAKAAEAALAGVRKALGCEDGACIVEAAEAARRAADGQSSDVLRRALGRVSRAQAAAADTLELLADIADDLDAAADSEKGLETALVGGSNGSVESDAESGAESLRDVAASGDGPMARESRRDTTPEGAVARSDGASNRSPTSGGEGGGRQAPAFLKRALAQSGEALIARLGSTAS